MAAGRKLLRYLSLAWDREAAKRVQNEAEESLARTGKAGGEEFEKAMAAGGRKAARALTTTLEREYKIRTGRARQQLAEGFIDERQFEKEGRDAAEAFNKGLTGGMRRLRAQGNASDLELANISQRLKRVPTIGGAGMGVAGLLRAGPLAGLFGGAALLSEAREASSAAGELEASVRRLGGTAKIAGLDLAELEKAAKANREEFKLGTPIANDLTGLMTQLADRSGDAGMAQRALAGWLDLAAARGLTAAEAMQALEVTIRGQDEGLNRLGLANPAEIYKKWGAGADQASKDTAILNEIVAESSKVQGEWARSMESATGQADQAQQRIRDLQAEAGKAIRPFQLLALELKIGLYEILGAIARRLGEVSKAWNEGEWAEGRRTRTEGLPDWLTKGRLDRGPLTGDRLAALDAAIATPNRTASSDPLPKRSPPELTPEQKRLAKALQTRIEAIEKRMYEIGLTAGSMSYDGTVREKGPKRPDFNREGPGGQFLSARNAPFKTELEELGRFENAFYDLWKNVGKASEEAAYQMSAAFQDTFQRMMEDGATAGAFLEGIGRGVAGSMLAGLAQYAQGKASENVAAAIEQGAKALGFMGMLSPAQASAAWGSAAQHMAAATAWSAAAGLAGAGRGAVTGGAGAIPGSTRDAGLNTAQDAERMGPDVTLYINPWDPANPLMQDSVFAAQQYASERWGPNARVTVRSLPRGGGR